jgi:hypothetical protein
LLPQLRQCMLCAVWVHNDDRRGVDLLRVARRNLIDKDNRKSKSINAGFCAQNTAPDQTTTTTTTTTTINQRTKVTTVRVVVVRLWVPEDECFQLPTARRRQQFPSAAKARFSCAEFALFKQQLCCRPRQLGTIQQRFFRNILSSRQALVFMAFHVIPIYIAGPWPSSTSEFVAARQRS